MACCAVQPGEHQQTLARSFTIGGLGLHTGEYGESISTCIL